jgi:hypothetical protein
MRERHAAFSKPEDVAKIQLSSRPGPQPFQSGAPSRHPARLQAKTLCRIGRSRPSFAWRASDISIAAVPQVVVSPELEAGNLILLDTECSLPDAELTVSYPLRPDSYLAAAVADLRARSRRATPTASQSDKTD